MKQYTYPAVFYYDEEYNDYAVEFSDICVYAEGDTMEEAYENAQDYLTAYLDCCDELGVAPNPPNTYDDVLKDHPNGKVMLVTVDWANKKERESNKKDTKIENEQTEQKPQETFTNLNQDIVESIETSFNDGDNPVMNELIRNQVQSKPTDDGDDGDDGDFSLPEIE